MSSGQISNHANIWTLLNVMNTLSFLQPRLGSPYLTIGIVLIYTTLGNSTRNITGICQFYLQLNELTGHKPENKFQSGDGKTFNT